MLNCGDRILSAFLLVIFMNECHGCPTKLDETFKETGSPYFYHCSCDEADDKKLNLKWLSPDGEEILGQKLGTRPKVYTERDHRGLNLLISSISKTLAGKYKCIAEYDGKTSERIILDLQAYDPVYFFDTPEDQYITKGQDSMIVCQTLGDEPHISWYKGDDEIIEIEEDDKYKMELEGLLIRSVGDDDEGEYKCTASAYRSGDKIERSIRVEVMTIPNITEIKTSKEKIVEGNFVTVVCKANGTPELKYNWSKLSKDGTYTNSRNQNGNALIFESITDEDRGTYICTASNKAGNDTETIDIEVLIPSKIKSFTNKTVMEGNPVQLICIAHGRPAPNIIMTYLEDERFDVLDTNVIEEIKGNDTFNTYILSFLEAKRSYEGHYLCEANNSVGYDNDTEYLEVQFKPHFPLNLELIWGWQNKEVVLTCEHDSKPASKILWSFTSNDIAKEEEISINKHLHELKTNSDGDAIALFIDKPSYFGTYECKATNTLGEDIKRINLKEGFPPPAVDINNITVIQITASSITFSIEGPRFEGPPIIGYTTEYDDINSYNFTNIHRNRTWAIDRPLREEKLRANTKYIFRFAAINEVGVGNWSEYIEVATPAKSPPNAPELQYLEVISGKAKVKWTVPASNGDPIDYFIIRYCLSENGTALEGNCEEKIIKAIETVIKNLGYNSTYIVKLWAHNKQGNSSAKTFRINIPIPEPPLPRLTAEGAIIVSVVVVIVCIVIMDLILCGCRKQGLFATCYYKKLKKRKHVFNARDRKVLLKENNEGQAQDGTSKINDDNSNNDLDYNRPTGIITGKHSSV